MKEKFLARLHNSEAQLEPKEELILFRDGQVGIHYEREGDRLRVGPDSDMEHARLGHNSSNVAVMRTESGETYGLLGNVVFVKDKDGNRTVQINPDNETLDVEIGKSCNIVGLNHTTSEIKSVTFKHNVRGGEPRDYKQVDAPDPFKEVEEAAIDSFSPVGNNGESSHDNEATTQPDQEIIQFDGGQTGLHYAGEGDELKLGPGNKNKYGNLLGDDVAIIQTESGDLYGLVGNKVLIKDKDGKVTIQENPVDGETLNVKIGESCDITGLNHTTSKVESVTLRYKIYDEDPDRFRQIKEPDPFTAILEAIDKEADKNKLDDNLSFAKFERRKRVFNDDTIMDIMNKNLKTDKLDNSGGFIKPWLDEVPSDKSDVEFTHNLDKVIGFRKQLSDFFIKRLKFRRGSEYPTGNERVAIDKYVKERRDEFIAGIRRKDVQMAYIIRNWDDDSKIEELRNKGIRYSKAQRYYGMRIKGVSGIKDPLLGETGNFLRSNFFIQQSPSTGDFIHYRSDAYEKARTIGKDTEITKRIYLNPKFKDSVAIFSEIVDAADKAGLVMKGKIYDRVSDGLQEDHRTRGVNEFATRGDGIVLYATDDSADDLLQLVSAVYKDHEESFKGRGVSRLPMKIADGLAIGEEPIIKKGEEQESLTSHRVIMLEKCRDATRQELGGDLSDRKKVIETFRRNYEKIAKDMGINPNNLAFNLKP